MRCFLVAIVATIVTGVFATSVPASPLKERYSGLYHAVAKKHGSRAPGRNIRRLGVRYRWHSKDRQRVHWARRPARERELAQSIRQLRLLLSPMMVAQPPAQLPGGVQTARAGGIAACIRVQESTNNYGAVSEGGTYRGAYQFDMATFASAGGRGDPAKASPAEQDAAFARWWPGHHSAWPRSGPACGG